MKRGAALVLAAALAAAALLFGALTLQRARLPYNEQGRHYDSAHSVVYDEGAVIVYGMLAGLCTLAAFGAAMWVRREWRR